MDGGSFYKRSDPRTNNRYPPSQWSHSAALNTGWTPIPDHLSYPPSSSHVPDDDLNSKIDRMTMLLEEQAKEIKSIRDDTTTLKVEVDRLKVRDSSSASSSTDTSTPPNSSRKRLPTELSVR